MLAKKGYCFGVWMYCVPLGWFVKSTLICPTPFSFVYCYVTGGWGGGGVTKCIVCVQGHDLLTFFLLSFLFFDWWEFYGPNYLKCQNLPAGPSFPQCPCRSRLSFSVSCYLGTNVSDSWESLHCFLIPFPVGVNKSYTIATSDLWLFIHASNLLPSLPTPLPYTSIFQHCYSKFA